jgi:hypothetical protein
VVDERLRGVAECMLGINNFGEPRLAQFDGTDKGLWPCRRSVGEREVRVLVTVADQFAQAQRTKAVLVDDAVPQTGVVGGVAGQNHRSIQSGLDADGSGQRWPHIPPFKNATVGDIERLVGCARWNSPTARPRSSPAASSTPCTSRGPAASSAVNRTTTGCRHHVYLRSMTTLSGTSTIFTRYGGIPQGISRTTYSHATTRTSIRVLDASRDVAVLAWVAMEES